MDASSYRKSSAIKGIVLLGLGLVFMIWPEQVVTGIAFYLGFSLLIGALISFYYTYRINKDSDFKLVSYLAPLAFLIGGLVLLLAPNFTPSVFAFVFGIWVLFDGLNQMRWSKEIEIADKGRGNWLMVMGVISIIVGVLIIFKPFELVKLMTFFFGLTMFFAGILEAYSAMKR